MESEFEKGIEYESKRRNVSFHLFLGWSCVILSPVFLFLSTWGSKPKIGGAIGILVIGGVSLWLGYSERKDWEFPGKVIDKTTVFSLFIKEMSCKGSK